MDDDLSEVYRRLSNRAKTVPDWATVADVEYNHGCLYPEHVFRGLLKVGGCARFVLDELRVNVPSLYIALHQRVRRGKKLATRYKHLPLAPMARQIFVLASRIARELARNYIGTEHILRAMLAASDEPTIPYQILTQVGDLYLNPENFTISRTLPNGTTLIANCA